MPVPHDPDLDWLMRHRPEGKQQVLRQHLSDKVFRHVVGKVAKGDLPLTIGIFGGWGAGKTTFLSVLADQLRETKEMDARVIYFNAWKYAGLMEIVPALIYKVLTYGLPDEDPLRDEKLRKVLLSLGKDYADDFGKWARERIGVNPVKLFKDVHKLGETVGQATVRVEKEVLKAYYSQVDRSQDEILKALGSVKIGQKVENPVIVLIDELDRCDPDEAFLVIKQLRVLFAMRQVPIIFIFCANPEPIGLAIKHKFGLESDLGDYESRRILEKFVDLYEDFNETISLGPIARSLWKGVDPIHLPWVISCDGEASRPDVNDDILKNSGAYDAFRTSNPFFANLRIVAKAFEHLDKAGAPRRALLWTEWCLEICVQVDPVFRKQLRHAAEPIRRVFMSSYERLFGLVTFNSAGKVTFSSDKGATIFAVLRSLMWEEARAQLDKMESDRTPEGLKRCSAMKEILGDRYKMDVLSLICLVPLGPTTSQSRDARSSYAEEIKNLGSRFGYLLAA